MTAPPVRRKPPRQLGLSRVVNIHAMEWVIVMTIHLLPMWLPLPLPLSSSGARLLLLSPSAGHTRTHGRMSCALPVFIVTIVVIVVIGVIE